jgi:hypothetical protein
MDTSIIQEKAIIALFFLFIACSSKNSSMKEVQQANKIQTTDGSDLQMITQRNETNHFFSSKEKQDVFLIELIGKAMADANVSFTIKNSDGIEIYSDKFKAKELFNYNLKPNSTREEENEFIIKRINEFFSEKNFLTPAVPIDDVYDENYNGLIDSITWNRIRRDKKSIGFYYILGEENKSWIVYDKAQNTVIKYQICC